MSRENEPSSNEKNLVSTWQIGFLFSLLAIFAPAFIVVIWSFGHSVSFQILGMLYWATYLEGIGVWYFESSIYTLLASMMFTFLRPVFAVQMVRYYEGKSSKRLTLLIGLITELQPMIVNFQTIILLTESYLGFRFPIPILLSLAIILLRIAPPQQKPETRLERDEEKSQTELSGDRKLQRSKLELVYMILETVLVAEIILLLLGGLFISNMHPFPLRFLYWVLIPWSTLITGVLFLIVRYIRKKRALWALYGLD